MLKITCHSCCRVKCVGNFPPIVHAVTFCDVCKEEAVTYIFYCGRCKKFRVYQSGTLTYEGHTRPLFGAYAINRRTICSSCEKQFERTLTSIRENQTP